MKKSIFLTLLSCLILISCNNENNTSSVSSSLSSIHSNTSTEFNYKAQYSEVNYNKNEELTYISNITNSEKHLTIHYPLNYSKDQFYPVLFLLHGMLNDHNSWFSLCSADTIIDNVSYFFNKKEFLTISINSKINVGEVDPAMFSEEYAQIYDLTGQEIIESVIPFLKDNFNILTGKDNFAICGFSMGGRESLLTAFSYQNYFSYIGAFSSASMYKNVFSFNGGEKVLDDFIIDENSTGFKYILLTTGKSDFMTNATKDYSNMMSKNSIEHTFLTLNGGHDYSVWSESLFEFVKNIF